MFVYTKHGRGTCLFKGLWSLEVVMNEREMMKLAETLDEFSMSDYTVQDLENMKKSSVGYDKYKENYFAYYDDVKDRSLKKQDW